MLTPHPVVSAPDMPYTDSQPPEVVNVLVVALTAPRPINMHVASASLLCQGSLLQHNAAIHSADVSVELAVCCLLLGDSEKAEDMLGLGPASPPALADPAIRSFVMVRFAC